MTDITRYEINEHGEIPLSYGRYIRWEDVQELLQSYEDKIERLHDKLCGMGDDYSDGYDDGYEACERENNLY